ncbi:MAG: RtcB family protein [Candidatus Aenigmatarchaeota archaeon]
MNLNKVSDFIWEIPKEGGMNVPARIYASEELLKGIRNDKTLEQVKNITHFPGIYKYSIALPDAHQGYGMPIGGVIALDRKKGGISPGATGYDINCGVRLIKTPLKYEEVKPKIKELVNTLFENVPSGVGVGAKINVSKEELKEVIEKGARWAVENGYGYEKDLEVLEENGEMEEADSSAVSEKALNRGKGQVGCLGAGNHFLEVEVVGDIKRPELAEKFGLEEGQVCLMIHTGSRGFGHQVCTDYLRKFEKTFKDLVSELPDRELVYAPGQSKEAEQYYKAMSCAANFAWANRQLITHWVRESFNMVFKDVNPEEMEIIYDICHNIAKKETHEIDGEEKEVFVHRKGATRALPPGHENVPDKYKEMGQPVLIPGDMGHGSYLLVGGDKSLDLSFGSTAHGAGRVMSRTKAKGKFWGGTVQKDLEKQDIIVKAENMPVVAEEAPGAYKNLDEVVEVSDKLDIANVVLKLDPKGVVKG